MRGKRVNEDRRKNEALFSEALKDFIRYMRDERQASPLTLDAYERDLLRFVNELEQGGHDLVLEHVAAEDVRAHMHRLIERRLARATVRRALYALGSFFRWAVRWELVTRSPLERITIPKRQHVREVRALSKRERFVIIAAADELANKSQYRLDAQASLLVRLLLKTGLRRAEVIALTWHDIDCERGELLVRRGKGGKARRVPIEDDDLLARLGNARPRGTTDLPLEEALARPVFINTRGLRLATSSFHRLFRRLLTHAKLKDIGITPHALRHTFGSVLCGRGVPVPYVKDLLGHEDIGSTMIYVHSTPAALRAAVRKLRE